MRTEIVIRKDEMQGTSIKSIRNIENANWSELRILCLREGVSISVKLNELIAAELLRKGE